MLARHPDVAQLAVGPVADDLRGDEVACLVVPRNPDQDMQALFDALFALASDQLAYYKAPGWFARVDSLPLDRHPKGAARRLAKNAAGDGRAGRLAGLPGRQETAKTGIGQRRWHRHGQIMTGWC